ncbi:hypothetical protein [Acinetobacter phage vB_AbaM_IME284]|nr:hypothetical protein [Acinetobacter phage vB_AbaM_IME284]
MDEFEEYYKNSEWFGTYQSDLMMEEAFEAGQQSMQAKMEELQNRVDELDDLLQSKQALLDKVWIRTTEMNKCLDEILEREKGVIKVIESMRNEVKRGHMEDEVTQMLSSFANDLKLALHGECTHESDGSFLLSDPPQTKCKKCGEFYFKNSFKAGDQ